MLHTLIYHWDLSYFAGPNSFYPEKIIKGEPLNIRSEQISSQLSAKGPAGCKEDKRRESVMQEFVRDYRKAYDRKMSAQREKR